jgi:hypothetical protein
VALTDVELCNVALGFIGHKRPISTLTANTVEAQQCAIYYPHAKGLVSAAHHWPFLERNALLAEHATATDVRFTFVYVAPADMLSPWFIWNGADRRPTRDSAVVFKRTDIGTGTNTLPAILTDQEDARLFYAAKNLPIAAYSDPVQDAIAWRLAAFLCGPLAVKPNLALGVVGESKKALAYAAALELNKDVPDGAPNPELLRVR